MGKSKRKYSAACCRFSKSLKKPIRDVLSVMPADFTADSFVSEFKVLYSYLWDDICAMSKDYYRRNRALVKKGFHKRHSFPSPASLLKTKARPLINNRKLCAELRLPPEEAIQFRKELIEKANAKQQKRDEKARRNLKYVQTTAPSYTNYYIQTYFGCKHRNPLDVDTRNAILFEASKYKSPITIKFLHKVNASERNYFLRNFAFQTLQKFGVKNVFLRKNRKGKKKQGDDIKPTPIESPNDLINFIYNSQLEHMKSYDLFLSHSSMDSALLVEIKNILNHKNIHVYIDWVCDRTALKRELTNQDTAKVILERLKSAKALLYVHTHNSLNSRWTPWKLGYFHALRDKICVYVPDNDEILPYMEIYPKAVLSNKEFYIKTGKSLIPIQHWINDKEQNQLLT